MKLLAAYCIILLVTGNAAAQSIQEINLYEDSIPGSISSGITERTILLKGTRRIYNVVQPTLTKFTPLKPNGISIIICPGGSYIRLSADNEGAQVARLLNDRGITAFVLKYRLPNDTIMMDRSVGPLQDLQQAIRLVRENAAGWNLQYHKVGVMGFSAGGHLASSAVVHFDFKADKNNQDTTSTRPDFAVLVYPVIRLSGELAHMGSRDNLLGPSPSNEKALFFSSDQQVKPSCPPVFLVHAADDATVPVENSIRFYEACLKNKVPVEMHLYPKGGHGFGLENSTTRDKWMERFFNWINSVF